MGAVAVQHSCDEVVSIDSLSLSLCMLLRTDNINSKQNWPKSRTLNIIFGFQTAIIGGPSPKSSLVCDSMRILGDKYTLYTYQIMPSFTLIFMTALIEPSLVLTFYSSLVDSRVSQRCNISLEMMKTAQLLSSSSFITIFINSHKIHLVQSFCTICSCCKFCLAIREKKCHH